MWGDVMLLDKTYSRKTPSAEGIGKRQPRSLGRKTNFTAPPDKALHTWLVGLGKDRQAAQVGLGRLRLVPSAATSCLQLGSTSPGEQLGSNLAAAVQLLLNCTRSLPAPCSMSQCWSCDLLLMGGN